MSLYFIELLLTKKCNQYCKYCDIQSKGNTVEVEADLDYIKWIIDNIPADNLFIETTGGEPGLIHNLSNVLEYLNSSNKVKRLQLMSNGLVRIKYPELISKVDQYNEHLVDKIIDTDIQKFYQLDFIDTDNSRTVVVLDETSTTSIIDNFDYFDNINLFDENKFWLKLFVDRTVAVSSSHLNNSIKLYNKLNTSQAMHCKYRLTTIDKIPQTICKNISWLPCIDVNDKKILHCAYHNFTNRIEYDCTTENLSKLINKTLFENIHAEYCDSCYLYCEEYEFLNQKNRANRK